MASEATTLSIVLRSQKRNARKIAVERKEGEISALGRWRGGTVL